MKKILLAAFVAVASLSANAQVWVGGELGFNTSKASSDGITIKKNTVTVAPEIGCKFTGNLDVAVKLEYFRNSGENCNDGFGINPYVRYTYFKSGQFSAFVDGGVAYEDFANEDFANDGCTSEVIDNSNLWEIAVKLGFAYSLTDKVGLVAHVGSLGWRFGKQGDVKVNNFGLNVTNKVSFGVYVNL